MSIGKRNRLVEFWELLPGGTDPANEPLPDAWVLSKQKWAEVKGETGMSAVRAAGQSGGIVTPLRRYSFRVSYDKSLHIGMQARLAGDSYNVVGVSHDEARREWTDVIAETGGSDG